MKRKNSAKVYDYEFGSVQSELLLNLITLVKIQQLNIELLWEAVAAGEAPRKAIAQMRESSLRLTDSVEQAYGMRGPVN